MASSRTVNSSKEPETSNGTIDSLSLDDADDGNGKVFSIEGFPGKRTLDLSLTSCIRERTKRAHRIPLSSTGDDKQVSFTLYRQCAATPNSACMCIDTVLTWTSKLFPASSFTTVCKDWYPFDFGLETVSYTHLTLPTICSV